MAQSGSAAHAARNDRIASALANANIICVPWVKKACASALRDEIVRVYGPSAFGISAIGFLMFSGRSPGLVGDGAAGAAGPAGAAACPPCAAAGVCSCAVAPADIATTAQRVET